MAHVGLLSQSKTIFISEGPRAELRMNEPTKALLREYGMKWLRDRVAT